MRVVVQRVNHCKVEVENQIYSEIEKGLLLLVGIKDGDGAEDIQYLVQKIGHLRIFEDEEGKMNRSVFDQGGQIMIVSQFTLYGDCKKGRRPSFIEAAKPEEAIVIYQEFVKEFRQTGLVIKTGEFQAHMNVILDNDGPVTFILESKKE